MLALFTYIHILIGIGLVLFVLLQDPKGGAMGVFSGGSSANSFFGSSGASNFLTATTRWLAILFAASCLGLTYMTARPSGSVMDGMATPPPAAPIEGSTQPAAPAPAADTAVKPAEPAKPTETK